MSDDDKKLPTRIEQAGLPEAPQNRSWLGWVGRAFGSILTTKTLQKKTEAAEAYRLYLEESARIPKAMLERDREVDNYLHNRDAIIENDRQERQRELDGKWAERKIEAEDDVHKVRMARLKRKSEEAQAQRELEKSQWGLDAFRITVPHRKERIDHLFRQGTIEAAGDMMGALNQIIGDEEEKKTPAASRLSTLEQKLAFVESLMDELASNPEAAAAVQALNLKKVHLKSLIEEEKNRPS